MQWAWNRPIAMPLRRKVKFGIFRPIMCETSRHNRSIGLLGLGLITLLVIGLLVFGHRQTDETAPAAPTSVDTNVVATPVPARTNIVERPCPIAAVTLPKEPPSPPAAKSVPSVTNAVAAKTVVRKIENDPKVPKNRQVLLSHRRIIIESGRKFPTRFCTSQAPTSRKTAPYVLLSDKPVDRSVHSQAMANGAKVAGFLPNNALLVEADETALKNLSEDPMFLAAVEYEPLDKIQPQLLNNTDEKLAVKIVLMSASYLDATRAYVTAHGGQVTDTAKNDKSFTALLPRKLVTALADKGEIRWIERKKEILL